MLTQPPLGILSSSFPFFIEGDIERWQMVKFLYCGTRYVISGFLGIYLTPSPTGCLISALERRSRKSHRFFLFSPPFCCHMKQWAKNSSFFRREKKLRKIQGKREWKKSNKSWCIIQLLAGLRWPTWGYWRAFNGGWFTRAWAQHKEPMWDKGTYIQRVAIAMAR